MFHAHVYPLSCQEFKPPFSTLSIITRKVLIVNDNFFKKKIQVKVRRATARAAVRKTAVKPDSAYPCLFKKITEKLNVRIDKKKKNTCIL
jgi:hypothetical protein